MDCQIRSKILSQLSQETSGIDFIKGKLLEEEVRRENGDDTWSTVLIS